MHTYVYIYIHTHIYLHRHMHLHLLSIPVCTIHKRICAYADVYARTLRRIMMWLACTPCQKPNRASVQQMQALVQLQDSRFMNGHSLIQLYRHSASSLLRSNPRHVVSTIAARRAMKLSLEDASFVPETCSPPSPDDRLETRWVWAAWWTAAASASHARRVMRTTAPQAPEAFVVQGPFCTKDLVTHHSNLQYRQK